MQWQRNDRLVTKAISIYVAEHREELVNLLKPDELHDAQTRRFGLLRVGRARFRKEPLQVQERFLAQSTAGKSAPRARPLHSILLGPPLRRHCTKRRQENWRHQAPVSADAGDGGGVGDDTGSGVGGGGGVGDDAGSGVGDGGGVGDDFGICGVVAPGAAQAMTPAAKSKASGSQDLPLGCAAPSRRIPVPENGNWPCEQDQDFRTSDSDLATELQKHLAALKVLFGHPGSFEVLGAALRLLHELSPALALRPESTGMKAAVLLGMGAKFTFGDLVPTCQLWSQVAGKGRSQERRTRELEARLFHDWAAHGLAGEYAMDVIDRPGLIIIKRT